MNNKYNQDDRVFFSLGENKPSGWGTVCGIQGFVIILKPDEPIKDYEFSHIYVIDSQITTEPKINENTKE